jgi:Tfp pilus assembly protein PilX
MFFTTFIKPLRIPRQPRRGAALVLTLVCLLVVAAIGLTLLRSLVDEHRQAAIRQREMQAFWLAESAIQRAGAALVASPEYTGEQWQVEADALAGRWSALAVIRVETVENDETVRRIAVEVRYPDEGHDRVVRHRQVLVKAP